MIFKSDLLNRLPESRCYDLEICRTYHSVCSLPGPILSPGGPGLCTMGDLQLIVFTGCAIHETGSRCFESRPLAF